MKTSIVVCVKERIGNTPSCAQGGGVQLADQLEKELAARGLEVGVKRMLCFGRCAEGPNARIAPGGAFFTRVTPDRLPEVLEAAVRAVSQEQEHPADPVTD
ncbi:MAG: (2Fe-2S) ferredoxin domain-containing protein [Magnetococcales bacterium]|nr:(2Fe-2S) ferredoxin domain-containing protein [Magnetococcales bacterium]